jgi:hypothetical protein
VRPAGFGYRKFAANTLQRDIAEKGGHASLACDSPANALPQCERLLTRRNIDHGIWAVAGVPVRALESAKMRLRVLFTLRFISVV